VPTPLGRRWEKLDLSFTNEYKSQKDLLNSRKPSERLEMGEHRFRTASVSGPIKRNRFKRLVKNKKKTLRAATCLMWLPWPMRAWFVGGKAYGWTKRSPKNVAIPRQQEEDLPTAGNKGKRREFELQRSLKGTFGGMVATIFALQWQKKGRFELDDARSKAKGGRNYDRES